MPITALSANSNKDYSYQNQSGTMQAGNFAKILSETQQKENEAEIAAEPAKAGNLGQKISYTAKGRLMAAKNVKDEPKNLIEAVGNLAAQGKKPSDELIAKLTGDNPKDFMDALSEITGRSQAQIMASLLNMSVRQAGCLAYQLGVLTDIPAAAFTGMLSKLTGHSDELIKQAVNNIGKEDEEKDEEKKKAEAKKEKESSPTTAAAKALPTKLKDFDNLKTVLA